jgi:hypothetical protein
MNVEATGDNNPSGIAEAFQFAAIASGNVSRVSIYLDASNAATQVVVGLYTNGTSGHPFSLLTQATISSPVSGAWNTTVVPTTTLTSGTKYWIAVLGPSGKGTIQFRDVASGTVCETSSQLTLIGLPTTWTSGASYADAPISAYASQ